MANTMNDLPRQASSSRRWQAIAGVIAGIILLVVAAIYFTQSASSLPAFFPGHVTTPTTQLHYKHGLAALLLALGAFVFAWFSSGPSSAK